MKRYAFSCCLLLASLFLALPCAAARDGVTVAVQGGYQCEYGVDIPFTRSARTSDYAFAIYAGDTPEVQANVTVTTDSPVVVHLPLRYDPAGPSTHTLQVTAHVAAGRQGLDREAALSRTFTTAPTCGCPAGTAGAFYVGHGSEGAPFLVASTDQLQHIGSTAHLQKKSSFLQTGHLDFEGQTVESIGSLYSHFLGHYNGNGYTVSNLNLQNADANGLFGYLQEATIENLGVVGATVPSGGAGGPIAGVAENSTIRRCWTKGCTVSQTTFGGHAGGLVGLLYSSSVVQDCYVQNITATADTDAAGLLGMTGEVGAAVSASNCYVDGMTLSGMSCGATIGCWFAPSGSYPTLYCLDSVSYPLYGRNNQTSGVTGTKVPALTPSYLSGFDFTGVWEMKDGLPRLQVEQPLS